MSNVNVSELLAGLGISVDDIKNATEPEKVQSVAPEVAPKVEEVQSVAPEVAPKVEEPIKPKRKRKAKAKKENTASITVTVEPDTAPTEKVPTVVKPKTKSLSVMVSPDDILQKMTSGNLIMAGFDNGILSQMMKSFLPIRYLKLEQKDPDNMGKILYKNGKEPVEFTGELYPIFYYSWRMYGAKDDDGNYQSVCRSTNGIESTAGEMKGTKCVNCPNASKCDLMTTFFFLSSDDDDDYIYTFNFKQGFNSNGLNNLFMDGYTWYKAGYVKEEHKGFKFLVPNFTSVDGYEPPVKADIERASRIIAQHLNSL